tara:strand:- start:1992 stop:2690 length:699 start_codon:yes stop_codon:yes gene_type:complete
MKTIGNILLASLLIGGMSFEGMAANEGASFRYCGAWRGYHTDSKRIGTGSVILIAPSWALTATHVARAKALTPNKRRVELRFGPDNTVRVEKAFLAPKGDLALLHLQRPIKKVQPASLLKNALTEKDGVVPFTLVGHSGGLHFHRDRRAKGTGLHAKHITKKADNPGKAGDSGGGWVIEDPKGKAHVLLGIIHGGGRATQPVAVRKWIDGIMAKSDEKATWVDRPKPPKRKK